VFSPRPSTFRYAMEWKYVKKHGELTVELRKLQDLKPAAVITHVQCDVPEVDGFVDRMKSRLGMPDDAEHPLLI